jgi:hypothetical protein
MPSAGGLTSSSTAAGRCHRDRPGGRPRLCQPEESWPPASWNDDVVIGRSGVDPPSPRNRVVESTAAAKPPAERIRGRCRRPRPHRGRLAARGWGLVGIGSLDSGWRYTRSASSCLQSRVLFSPTGLPSRGVWSGTAEAANLSQPVPLQVVVCGTDSHRQSRSQERWRRGLGDFAVVPRRHQRARSCCRLVRLHGLPAFGPVRSVSLAHGTVSCEQSTLRDDHRLGAAAGAGGPRSCWWRRTFGHMRLPGTL